tara:strand:+ start:1078 stop:1587 length:510 start_codon:yes stop_codon:yes gene_type:complete
MYANNDIDNKQMDCIEIASNISSWCERNYGYFIRSKSDKAQTIKDFSEQIARLTVHQQNTWHIALNQHYDMGLGHPPLPAQIIKTMRGLAPTNNEEIKKLAHNLDVQIDWYGQWKSSDHESKMNFFKDHKPQGVGWTDIPAYIQYEARKYYVAEAGMSLIEANSWMKGI